MSSFEFGSRRSTVYSTKAIVSSTQPQATAAGIKILEQGGNCVDAAVAVGAVLCVLEPASTGIGGDCFALFYEKKSKKVHGLNGSGRAAALATAELIRESLGDPNAKRIPWDNIFSVTVPGAIAGWVDAIEKWGSGKVSLEAILEPAIKLARDGFVVHEISANMWSSCAEKLRTQNVGSDTSAFLNSGKAPVAGEFVKNQKFADALELIAKNGKDGFYKGPIAEAIIKVTSSRKHVLSLDDLKKHHSTFEDPISVEFEDQKVWEISPNGQGLVALLALGMLRELQKSGEVDLSKLKHNSAEYLHLLIELSKLGFYDSDQYVADIEFNDIPLKELLDEQYLAERSKLFQRDAILDGETITHGVPNPINKSDTVYYTVTDLNGDACSFINSVYEGFGSAIIVPEYGFCLQNRGANFNLNAGTPNFLEGGKRPYHTIIPSMITNIKDNSLFAAFGNMGGYMQPVGHVQHVLNLTVFGMTPQELVDQPRFCLMADSKGLDRGRGSDGPASTPVTVVALEEGIEESVVEELKKLGHTIKVVSGFGRGLFGRSQIIQNVSTKEQLIYAAGSDPRGDGFAAPLL